METLYFLGIDVSKKKFDAALTIDGKHFHEVKIENTSGAVQLFFRDLKKKLSSLDTLIVCLEHTGIYSIPILEFLVKKKIRVCVEPALQIKQSQGMTRGKNDQVDAKRIALYALKNRESLRFWQPQRHCIQRLKALLALRERLVKMKVQLEVPINESAEFVSNSILKEALTNCHRTLRALQSDIQQTEKEIEAIVLDDEHLAQQCKLATSVPGIGKITALNIIISTHEFSRIQDAKKICLLRRNRSLRT
jgi:transposase